MLLGLFLSAGTALFAPEAAAQSPVTFSIHPPSPASGAEGNASTTDKVFTYSLSGTPSADFTFALCFTGTATPQDSDTPASGDDYVIRRWSRDRTSFVRQNCNDIFFSTSNTVVQHATTVRVYGDTVAEGDETVILTIEVLDDATHVVIGTSSATYTINNDDGMATNTAPTFPSATYSRSIAENAAANANVGAAIPAATDADSDSLTYTMGGADAGSFTFDAGTRQITTRAGVTYDYEADSSYTVTVTADDSNGGTAVTTVTITLTDVAEPPVAPSAPSVTATAGSTTSLDVSWSAPANAGKPNIASYDLQYRVGSTGSFTNGPQNVTGTSTTITGLTAGTAYEVQVRATNAEGDGPWSASGSGSTPAASTTHTLSMSIATAAADEGDADHTDYPLTFTTAPARTDLSDVYVDVCLTGTAAHGTDYTFVDGTFGQNLGVTTRTDNRQCLTVAASTDSLAQWVNRGLEIRVSGDSAVEPDETVILTLGRRTGTFSTPADVVISNTANSVTHTVRNDDAAEPEVTILRGTSPVTEGTAATFTVSADPAPASNLDVSLTVADAPNADFVASGSQGAGKTVRIPTGMSSATYTVATVGGSSETDDEPSGPVTVTVNGGSGYTVGTAGSAAVTVTDDDATAVTLTVPDATATEGSSTATAQLRLTLGRALRGGESLAVPFQFSGGVPGTDFTLALSGSLTGVAFSGSTVTFTGSSGGSATAATVTLTASEDADTDDETVTASIPAASTGNAPRLTATGLDGGAAGSRSGNGVITLTDNDAPAAGVTLSPASLALTEGHASDGAGTYTAVLATDPGSGVTVTVTPTSADTGAATVSPASRAFTGGNSGNWSTAQTFTVTAARDGDVADESFNVTHATTASGGTGPYHNLTAGDVAVTVTDAGHGFVVSPGTVTVRADDDTATYSIRLKSSPGAGTVTVTPTSGDVSKATVSGAVSFTSANWSSPKTITVTGKGTAAGSTTITHAVTAPSGNAYRNLTPGSVAVTVTSPLPALTIAGGPAVTEGTGATFTVTASPTPTTTLVVSRNIEDAPGANFVADADEGDNDTWLFEKNLSSKTFTVATTADGTAEPGGKVRVTLRLKGGSLQFYTLGDPASATVTVSDDDGGADPPADPAVTITRTSASMVTEGASATFRVSASPAPSANLAVSLTVTDAPGANFVASGNESATVTIAAGTTSATFTLPTVADGTAEPGGLVKVTVTDGSGYTVGAPAAAAVTVSDDDGGADPPADPVVTIARTSAATLVEGGSATFTVSADPAPFSALTVNLTVADAPGANFVTSGNENARSVTIAASTASATFTLPTEADTTDEPNGPVAVTVADGDGYTVGAPASAAVTMNDDDATRVELWVDANATAAEGDASDTAEITVFVQRSGGGMFPGEALAVPLLFSGGVRGTDFSLALKGTPTGGDLLREHGDVHRPVLGPVGQAGGGRAGGPGGRRHGQRDGDGVDPGRVDGRRAEDDGDQPRRRGDRDPPPGGGLGLDGHAGRQRRRRHPAHAADAAGGHDRADLVRAADRGRQRDLHGARGPGAVVGPDGEPERGGRAGRGLRGCGQPGRPDRDHCRGCGLRGPHGGDRGRQYR